VALQAILTAAATMTRPVCATHGQQFTVTLPTEPVWIEADATRLEQVFNNLLGNACKYSGDGSHIEFTAEVVHESHSSHSLGEGIGPMGIMGPMVVVRVTDDGAGIDPELLPRVFDLFVQSTRTLDRAHGGLGIGLTLVQRLVNLHGGSITAHSEGLDQGAEFVVRLPILAAAPPPSTPPQVARETPRRMLIVDDNIDSARSLALLESRRGHETRIALTGPEAVAAAAAFRPEVVLLDIGLPGMDGFEVARQIRAMPALAGAFLIAMSGYGREEDRAEARLAGFDEYLVKPVDLDHLRDLLRERS
jgi:CheY-like chemotaxis protein/two-component sensor histidine kinase